ncbi:MAG: RnfABCDGE type electron transport complex subunit D [Ruminococcus sp.]|nr:RnfABCDGE type electron transport complex subunit D [Ruminococcus sp.]
MSDSLKSPVQPANPNKFAVDTLIVTSVLAITAVFYYGRRAAVIALISVAAAVLSDIAASLLRYKSLKPKTLFSGFLPAIGTGLINAVIMPVTIPYGAVIAGAVVSVLVLRAAFGGVRSEIINPSAGALLFVFYAFPGRLNIFTRIFTDLPLSAVIYPENAGGSFFGRLINEGVITGDIPELVAGRLPFMMGGCLLLIIAAAVFFIIRRDFSGISFITACAVFFGITYAVRGDITVCLYALAGILPAITLTALTLTSRFSGFSAKLIYGALLGGVCALFVWYSKNEYGGFFAAVILSPLAVYFANSGWGLKNIIPDRFKKIKLS